jgi:hypothetical protein
MLFEWEELKNLYQNIFTQIMQLMPPSHQVVGSWYHNSYGSGMHLGVGSSHQKGVVVHWPQWQVTWLVMCTFISTLFRWRWGNRKKEVGNCSNLQEHRF